jgi:hypothetical protein
MAAIGRAAQIARAFARAINANGADERRLVEMIVVTLAGRLIPRAGCYRWESLSVSGFFRDCVMLDTPELEHVAIITAIFLAWLAERGALTRDGMLLLLLQLRLTWPRTRLLQRFFPWVIGALAARAPWSATDSPLADAITTRRRTLGDHAVDGWRIWCSTDAPN